MPPNRVLEYDVIDPRQVRLEELGKPFLRPAACEQLKKRYEEGCAKAQKQKPNRTKEREDEDEGSIERMCKGKEAYESFCRHGDLTIFLGASLENPYAYPDHPKEFFNDRILESFPELQKTLRIVSIGRPGAPCKHACEGSHDRGQTFLREVMPQGHFVEAGDVVDCEATGPIAIFS